MSRKAKLLLVVVLLTVVLAGCATVRASSGSESQVVSASTAQSEPLASSRTMIVVGVGKVSLKPDIATVSIGVETRASTVSEAKAEVDARMASVVAALQEAGIAEKDIRTSQYSIHYERDPVLMVREGPAQENQDGYRVSNTVQVAVRDLEKASDILDAVVQAGANQVYGVTFAVSDKSTWQSAARTKAVTDARNRALGGR